MTKNPVEKDLLELGKGERAFLHDISSPMGVAYGMLEATIELIQDGDEDPSPKNMQVLKCLKKAMSGLEKSVDLLRKRREVLIKMGIPSSKSP